MIVGFNSGKRRILQNVFEPFALSILGGFEYGILDIL